MTVVVAVKSGDYLQPRGRQVQFEPGIIMAGDTRVSFIGGGNRPPEDDHVKVDSIGDFAIAGYAGDLAIATSVLGRLEEAVVRGNDFSSISVASVAKRMLIDENLRRSPFVAPIVQILLGIRDTKTNKFVLYEMASEKGFEPQPRDGMAAIGSHGQCVKDIFEDIRSVAAQIPRDPFKGPQVTLKENLAQFVWFLLDEAIKAADIEAKVTRKDSLIGGRPHLIALHSRGVEALNPVDNARLRL